MNNVFVVLPPHALKKKKITASVGFVTLEDKPDKYIIVRNKRGWDIPGGHLENGESPLQAFKREIQEETFSKLMPKSKLIAVLESTQHPLTGIAVFKGVCRIDDIKQYTEISGVALVTVEELTDKYFGDKDLLQKLLIML